MSLFLKRWWWALLLMAMCLGLWRLQFSVNILDLLPPDEPTVKGLKLYEKYFTNARELVITLRAPEAERAERLAGLLAKGLRQQTNLVADVTWQPPWMEDPGQMAELLGCLWFNQPPEAFSALTNKLAPDKLKPLLEETKDLLTTSLSPLDMARRAFDPFDLLNMPALTNLGGLSIGQGQAGPFAGFASADGAFRLVFVQSAVDLAGYRSCEHWLNAVQATVARLRTGEAREEWEGVVIRYTGRPVFVREIASSMQRDMSGSVVATAAIIALLFWLTHRRWLPMLWLLTLLGLILGATLALGGLVLGTISVVSMGFAALLLGLAVDYAVVHYQEALAHPQLSVPEIRRAIAPSILWAAITTISAFLVLNLGGLPGLGQLGTLVALGVGVAALVMVMIYLPPLFPGRRRPPPGLAPVRWWTYFFLTQTKAAELVAVSRSVLECGSPLPLSPTHAPQADLGSLSPVAKHPPGNIRTALVLTSSILLVACAVLCVHPPGLDKSGNALRPLRGEAETALDEIKLEMGLPADPLWLMICGRSEPEVYRRLVWAVGMLDGAVSNRLIGRYLLPDLLWPRVDFQAANQPTATALGKLGPTLRDAALKEGFNTNALALTEQLARIWARAGTSREVVWPTNVVSRWLLKRFVARTPDEWVMMGLVYPATNRADAASLAGLSSTLAEDKAFLSGWELLGSATLKRVRARMWRVVTPMVVLVLASLWFAFGRATEILLGLAVLALSGLVLLATMAAAGWSWNLLNLMAVPLILGTGVDYTIFIQLALRRHQGDVDVVRRSVGRALLLCGGTAIAGFGSLGWSSSPGMASLGKVCAVGIGANMLISVFLLPAWWRGASPRPVMSTPKQIRNPKSAVQETESSTRHPVSTIQHPASGDTQPASPALAPLFPTPSAFYRAGLWRAGLTIAGLLPAGLVKAFCVLLAECYCLLFRRRRQTVVKNLLPALYGDRCAATKVARRLHRNFARKLVDLWRVESGVPVRDWLTVPAGLDIIRAAHQRGRGVLFITLHLGNWEHGGLLLSQLGIPLTILTLAEPDDGLTELRTEMRRRYGVETLVIGRDDFAFVEVIKRLQAGAAMAISIDRPPPRGAVTVQFFGRPFGAPAAAAELARASGCALIGVIIVRRRTGYAVKVLPEFAYDRRMLGNREARRELTGQILRAFEPEIRQNLDQWYQFVPIWPQTGAQ